MVGWHMVKNLASTPLPFGELAPNFELQTADGHTITRSQFRGKSALVLLFVQPTVEATQYWNEIGADSDEYNELNARVLVIVEVLVQPMATPVHSAITLLADPNGAAWKAYSGTDQPGYGAFMLDL